MQRKLSSIKVIKTGFLTEIYLYKFPIAFDYKADPIRPSNDIQEKEEDEEKKEKNKNKSANRAKNNIRRLITGNLYEHTEIPKFITFTFKENIQDLEATNYHFRKFIQRLEYKLQRKLHYLATHELQQRGAIHYHAIFLNLPRIDHSYLQAEWGNHVWIKNVYRTKGLYSYLVKYITKSFDDDRFKGKKRYLQTLVHRPFTVRDREQAFAMSQPLLNSAVPLYTPRSYPVYDRKGEVVNEVTKVDFLTPATDFSHKGD